MIPPVEIGLGLKSIQLVSRGQVCRMNQRVIMVMYALVFRESHPMPTDVQVFCVFDARGKHIIRSTSTTTNTTLLLLLCRTESTIFNHRLRSEGFNYFVSLKDGKARHCNHLPQRQILVLSPLPPPSYPLSLSHLISVRPPYITS